MSTGAWESLPLSGTHLIEASAGTGKTHTLCRLYLRLLLESRLSPRSILVVTFTEAAAKELHARIREVLQEARRHVEGGAAADPLIARIVDTVGAETARRLLIAALRSFDEAAVATIHGFCRQVLLEHSFESGVSPDSELETESDLLLRDAVHDFWRNTFYETHPVCVRYALRKNVTPAALTSLARPLVGRPELRIVPDIPTPPSLPRGAPDAFTGAVDALGAVGAPEWEEASELLHAGGLKRTRYKPSRIATLFAALRVFLSAPDPLLFDGCELLTNEVLRKQTKKGGATPRHPFFDRCSELVQQAGLLRAELDAHLVSLRAALPAYVNRRLAQVKAARNICTFDDLPGAMYRTLRGPARAVLRDAVRQRYHAALIDEFQDTDPVQYFIFNALFGDHSHPLLLIGDPKQSIYSFRGADIFTYIDAARGADRMHTLGVNYRSEPALTRAVNTIFAGPRNPFVYGNDIPFRPVDSPASPPAAPLTIDGRPASELQLLFLASRNYAESGKRIARGTARPMIASLVARRIAHLLNLGRERKAMLGTRPLEPRDVAVLVQSRYEARDSKEALGRVRVPAVLSRAGNLFDTDEACEVRYILQAAARPHDESLVKGALSTRTLGHDAGELYGAAENTETLERYSERFRTLNAEWNTHGFMHMFNSLMLQWGVRTRLPALAGGERQLTNLLHLAEILHHRSRERHEAPPALLDWFSSCCDPSSPRREEHELRLESDENAVSIVTMHKAKGLQYPVVFCPYLWRRSECTEEAFVVHDSDEEGGAVFDAGSPDRDRRRALAARERLAENVRLMYVALTRARNLCCVVWGRFNTAETSAPAWVFHRPPDEPPEEETVAQLGAYVKGLDDDAMLESLAARARASGGTIQLHRPEADEHLTAEAYRGREHDAAGLDCREFSGTVPPARSLCSFSSLVHPARPSPEDVDSDQFAAAPEPAPEEAMSPPEPPPPDSIFAFPRGARAGQCLHAILQEIDFSDVASPRSITIVRESLERYGFEQSWEPTLLRALQVLVDTPLPVDTQRVGLGTVPLSHRLNELEFFYPLAPVTPTLLSRAFATHAGHTVPTLPTGHIDSLQFNPARGFMHGFIDCVLFDGTRYYVIDWKSNHLGDTLGDYAQAELEQSILREHYYLQYHIYTVAVHRYLGARMRDYAYERHFGGVLYVFLRGIGEHDGTVSGVYAARPSRRFIEHLDKEVIGR